MTYSLEHTFEQKRKRKNSKKQNQQNETNIFRHFNMQQVHINYSMIQNTYVHHEIVTNTKHVHT